MEQHLPSMGMAARQLLLAFFLCFSFSLQAQDNPLNRKISVRLSEEKLADALWTMGRKGEFNFAYNPEEIPADSLVSLRAKNELVRQLLDQMFQGSIIYKPIGNHIVLRLRIEEIPDAPETILLAGYLVDGETGEKIHNATVYEGGKHKSVLTGKDGSYSIQVPGQAGSIPISFSRVGYRDTVVVIRPGQMENLTVGLMPRPHSEMSPLAVNLIGDSYHEELPLADFFVPEFQQKRAFNIQAALARFPFQISLVPSIGTNGLMSGGMTNHVSINLLAGYANGLKGFEVGGLANIIREDVIGFQVAGISNVVGGNVTGMQVGGISNHVKGSLYGLQVGGIYNRVSDTLTGFQVAGIANVIDQKIKGFQIAGWKNVAKKNVEGAQIAGFVNSANGSVELIQVAGFANNAKGNVGGGQVAGFYNSSKDSVGGFQISGFVNKAKYVGGLQVGLFNFADTLDGYAIGLVNWSRNGYKAIGVSSNEINELEVSLLTGHEKLYTKLFVGQRFRPERRFAWSYGAGIGTSIHLTSWLRANFELTVQQVNEEGLGYGKLNLVESFRPSLTLRPTRWLELSGGPAISLGQTDGFISTGEFISDTPRNPFWIWDGYSTRNSAWWGYQGALRIRF